MVTFCREICIKNPFTCIKILYIIFTVQKTTTGLKYNKWNKLTMCSTFFPSLKISKKNIYNLFYVKNLFFVYNLYILNKTKRVQRNNIV